MISNFRGTTFKINRIFIEISIIKTVKIQSRHFPGWLDRRSSWFKYWVSCFSAFCSSCKCRRWRWLWL